jgi:concanavalin A-like lectin/glucanase superfamily protein
MARIFNGTTDRIDFANVFSTTGRALTISMWINLDILAAAASQYLFNNSPSGGGAGTVLFNTTAASGALSFFRNYDVTALSRVSQAGVLQTGRWTHVALTDLGSGVAASVRIFVNGQVLTSYSETIDGSGTETSNASFWSLGGRQADDIRNMDGRMAEVGVWDRRLTLDEIKDLGRGDAPLFFPSGLRFYAPLDGRTPERNLVGAIATTMDGTSVQSFPVPIKYPRGRPRYLQAAAENSELLHARLALSVP